MAIRERALGPNHPDTASTLNNLAILYYNQGKYEQAEPLYQRALVIKEHVLGPNHPDTAMTLNNLAGLYRNQGKYEQAEPLVRRALAVFKQVLGPNHPHTIGTLNNLTNLQDIMRKKPSKLRKIYQIIRNSQGTQNPKPPV